MKHTPGPLPSGWSYKSPYLTDEEGYQRHVVDNGRIDRNKVAVVLENHGYMDHARRWYLSPLEAAAPEMLEALKELIAEFDARNEGFEDIRPGYFKDTGGIIIARMAVAKAEGR